MTLAGPGYSTPDRQRAFIAAVLDRVRQLPGVESAAVVTGMPIGNAGNFGSFQIEARPRAPRGQEPKTGMIDVSPNYFKVLGVPLLQGRMLNDHDE